MNLTHKKKQHIVEEFKRGRDMAENDRVFMLKPGTTERLVRDALRAALEPPPQMEIGNET